MYPVKFALDSGCQQFLSLQVSLILGFACESFFVHYDSRLFVLMLKLAPPENHTISFHENVINSDAFLPKKLSKQSPNRVKLNIGTEIGQNLFNIFGNWFYSRLNEINENLVIEKL